MKLLIRLDSLFHPRTGIGYYTENLVKELLRVKPEIDITGFYQGQLVHGDNLQLLLNDDGRSHNFTPWKGSQKIPITSRLKTLLRSVPGAYPARQAWLDFRGVPKINSIGANIYHEPNYIPMSFKGPKVITVHDISHVRYPQYHPRERVAYLNRYLPKALRDSDCIITDSTFIRDELCEIYPDVADKVFPVLLGVDDEFRVRSEQETFPTLRKWKLRHGEYIFSSATLEPRKNLAGLVKTYRRLPAGIRKSTPLVLAGGKGWKTKEFKRLLSDKGCQDDCIILTGRVSRKDLSCLMSGARLFAYPSFYEGFGLPVAEAMASGVPVLTSNRGSMKEIANESCLLVDPDNFFDELLTALESSFSNHKAFRYLWSDTALKTASIYKKVIQ